MFGNFVLECSFPAWRIVIGNQPEQVPTAKVYLKLGVVPIQPRLYLKVPVNFYDDKYGEVSTVMLTRSEDLFQGTTGIGGIIYGRLK